MATLQEEIKDLNDEIAEYRVKLSAATTLEEKKMYADLITAKEAWLLFLLQQQQQQQGNNYPPPHACHFNIAALKLILSLGSPLTHHLDRVFL